VNGFMIATLGACWHIFAAALGRSGEEALGTFHDLGVVTSASIFVTESIEPFVRFDVVLPDGDRAGDDPFRTVTLGGNWFIHGHSLKITLDAQLFLDDVAGNDVVRASSAQGLLPGADAGSFAIRAQLQFVF